MPLYPSEAYSEQNNARAFTSDTNSYQQNYGEQKKEDNPLSALFGKNSSPLLPLLIKLMSGGNISSALSNSDNPLLNILSQINSKKNSSSQKGEKEFPD